MARLYAEAAASASPEPGAAVEATMVLGGQEFIYTDQDWTGCEGCLDDAVAETLASAGRHLAMAKAMMAGAKRLMAKHGIDPRKVVVHAAVLTFLGIEAVLLDPGVAVAVGCILGAGHLVPLVR